MRGAAKEQQQLLWSLVAEQLQMRLYSGPRSSPVWLNTDGSGVPWLHVRLDSKPKYIKHAEYRALSESAGGSFEKQFAVVEDTRNHGQHLGGQFIMHGAPLRKRRWLGSTRLKVRYHVRC